MGIVSKCPRLWLTGGGARGTLPDWCGHFSQWIACHSFGTTLVAAAHMIHSRSIGSKYSKTSILPEIGSGTECTGSWLYRIALVVIDNWCCGWIRALAGTSTSLPAFRVYRRQGLLGGMLSRNVCRGFDLHLDDWFISSGCNYRTLYILKSYLWTSYL